MILLSTLGLIVNFSFSSDAENGIKIPLKIDFRDSISTDKTHFTLGDIAHIEGPENVVAAVSETVVGKAANFGLTRYLETFGIYIRYLKPLEDRYSFKMPLNKRIKIKSKAGVFSQELLTNMINDSLKHLHRSSTAKIDFEYIRVPKKLRVPTGDYSLKLEIPKSFKRMGLQNLTLQIRNEEKILRRVPIGIKVRMYDSVWVANGRIPRGTELSRPMFKREYREVSALTDYPVYSLSWLINRQAKQTIIPNRVLTSRLFVQSPLVHQGEQVQVVNKRNGVSIIMNGVARQNGVLGQVIYVKNMGTNKIIRARVVKEKTLEWVAKNVRG